MIHTNTFIHSNIVIRVDPISISMNINIFFRCNCAIYKGPKAQSEKHQPPVLFLYDSRYVLDEDRAQGIVVNLGGNPHPSHE